MGILLIVGVLLYTTQQSVHAFTIDESRSVTVSGRVLGPPPQIGARFLSPQTHITTTSGVLPVSGSCAPTTLVVVDADGQTAGSAQCTTAGTFTVPIQLQSGGNVLQARNYDPLNQAGPDTPTIFINFADTTSSSGVTQTTPLQPTADTPSKTAYPTIKTPAFMPNCYDYKGDTLPTVVRSLVVRTTCIVRGAQPNQQSQLGVMAYGGTPPYTISVDWGNQTRSSIVVAEESYQLMPFAYDTPGTYTVQVRLTDKTGATARMQTVIEVDGQLTNGIGSVGDATTSASWLTQLPIPAYVFIVSLTVCLWGISLVERHFRPHLYVKKHRMT